MKKNKEKLYTLIKSFLKLEEDLLPDSGMKNISKWTSLVHVELILRIEKEFNISINPLELHNLVTVHDLLDYINEVERHESYN